MEFNLDLLKEVLSVPTKTYKEEQMVKYICDFLENKGINYYKDSYNNVYATKQSTEVLPDNFYFPCVVSHTDTVHQLGSINVVEETQPNAQGLSKLALKAYNDNGYPTGIGGDDKCGVFACLTLLQELPN